MRRRPLDLRRGVLLGLLALGGLGCGTDERYMVVTVTGRPAVHDASALRVTLANGGTMRTDELVLGSHPFPVTFSISAPGRTGDLGLTVEAVDATGLIVGRGAATATVESTEASVMLDSTDFVINTEFAGDQFPSDDYEAHGFQVTGQADGTWTTAYRDRCTAPCNMFGRRFDKTGRPVSTKLAAGTNGFPISTELTSSLSTPAIATAGATTLAVWDFDDQVSTTVGVACRAIDAAGMGLPNQLLLASDPSTDVVSITPLTNNNFAVTWNALITTNVIRAAIVRPDCTLLGGISTVSTVAAARRVSVASTTQAPGTLMYAWIVDGGVHVRLASNTNAFSTVDQTFLPKTATEVVEAVRVAPMGTGFGVFVRWALSSGSSGPGRIELYRTTSAGTPMGAPIPVTQRSGSDFQSSEAFGVTARADGVVMVVWHSCLTNGDGSGCGVFGRAFNASGAPLGAELTIPTTTVGDQTNPSVAPAGDGFVVVWKDDSGQAPDIDGSAIRGRIVYPTP